MIPRPFDDVAKQDIDDLVAEARPERRTLESKQALPNLAVEEDEYEFLAAVASFANVSGGDGLFGVVDERDSANKPTGIPESAPGVAVLNADAVIRQLEQSARSNIDPKIPGLRMRAIAGFPSGSVVLARVPKSYVAPHVVRNDKQWGRFYSRGSGGKHILDVGEVRSAVALSESLPQRVRDFRVGRVTAVVADEGPVRLGPGPLFVLHVLPISALDPLNSLDVTPAARWGALR